MKTFLSLFFCTNLLFIFLFLVFTIPADNRIVTKNLSIPPLTYHFVSQPDFTTSKPVNCLAQIIYHEGRGESRRTQVLIAETALNRVRDSGFPSTICSVMAQRTVPHVCQFSWMCNQHPIHEKNAWKKSLKLANYMYIHYYLRHDVPDQTRGSLYFTTLPIHRGWMKKMNVQARSGDLKFLAAD